SAAVSVLMASGRTADAPMLAPLAGSSAGTAVLVVALVVASTSAAALRRRTEQYALLRAVGATPAQVRSMVTAEVGLVFAVAAPSAPCPACSPRTCSRRCSRRAASCPKGST